MTNGVNPGDINVPRNAQIGTPTAQVLFHSLSLPTHSFFTHYHSDEYFITDTVGFGSPQKGKHIDAIFNLCNTLINTRYTHLVLHCTNHLRHGYHVVLFVAREVSLLDYSRAVFDMYMKTIFPDMAKHFRIVYTQYCIFFFLFKLMLFSCEYDMDVLKEYPDPMGRGIPGVCTGLILDETQYYYEVSLKNCLPTFKKCILHLHYRILTI